MNPLSTRPHLWRPITVFNLLVGLLFSLSALAQPAFLKEGLVAYYPFNGNANDESGNGYNGTVQGATLVVDRNSSPNKSYRFDGSTKINVGNPPTDEFDLIGDSTLSLWISAEKLQYQFPNCFIGKDVGPGTQPKWVFGLAADPNRTDVKLYFDATTPGYERELHMTEFVAFSLNKYTHLVVVKSGKNLHIFNDGAKVYSGLMKRDLVKVPANLTIGFAEAPTPFVGSVDDVRIYNRALSDTEVQALYAYESTPPDNSFITNGLVAYYPFNGNANDESGNSYNGQLIAGTFAPNRFGSQNGTLDLNGDNQYVSIPNFTAIDNAEQATFSCWIKSPSIGNKADTVGNPIFMRWLSGGSYAGAVGLIASETKGMVTTAVIGGFGTESSTAPMVSDQWQQMVIVFDGRKTNPSERLKYYVNSVGGVFKDYAAANPSRLGAVGTVTYIGRYAWSPISFKGKIDDVRIYNRALSDGEIKALYDYESTSPIQSPVFVSQPVSKTVNSGDNVVLSVGLQTAGTYNYQWQLNEQNIAGATASSLAVNNAVAGIYRYRVIVSNSAGTVISDTATLTVSTPPAPSIVTQPAPKTVQEGANVSLNVVATGQGSLVYQWQFNEQNLPGATSATLNLNGVKLNTAGRYRVLVSSQYGVTISDTVTLTVNANPPPSIVTQPLSRTPAEGTQVSLTVTATGLGSLTYQWQVNGQNIPGATSSTLVLSAVRPSVNGNYRVIVGNPYGTTISTEATVAVVVTDADSDGLSDYEELLLGTNANKADSDGDGLSDFAEVRTHGSNPLTTDTDGDGYSDGIEVARDGNPNNRSVMPTGALAVFPAVDVEFYTLNSVKYQLEVSTDMVSWTVQGGVVVGNGGSQNHLVRASKATQFWRLKVVQ